VHGIEARLSPDAETLYFTNGDGPSGPVGGAARFVWRVHLELPRLRRLT
jgi:hypothetical protein